MSNLSKFLNTQAIRLCASLLSNTEQQSYDEPPLTAHTAHHAIRFGGLTEPSRYSTSTVRDNAADKRESARRIAQIRHTATIASPNQRLYDSFHNSHSMFTARQQDSKSPYPASNPRKSSSRTCPFTAFRTRGDSSIASSKSRRAYNGTRTFPRLNTVTPSFHANPPDILRVPQILRPLTSQIGCPVIR